MCSGASGAPTAVRRACIYPPVRTDAVHACEAHKDDYYVTVSRLVTYKRIDLMLDAFRLLPRASWS